MPDSVIIVSGGMDSVTLLHFLVRTQGRSPAAITFSYGQKHDKEVGYARHQVSEAGISHHLVLDITLLRPLFLSSALVDAGLSIPGVTEVTGDPQPPTYVPNRNMVFLALAAAYAETLGVDAVYYGAQRHDLYGYWDTTPEFVEGLNAVFGLNRRAPIRVEAPFVDYSKADLLRIGLELGVNYGRTWSCYEGRKVACGRCPTCAERLQAFAEVGISDPLPYA